MSGTYENIIYFTNPRPESHPANLATLATLFNLAVPDLNTARVLELGAGTGGNLIPMAELFPKGSFLGIDLSEKQVAIGKDLINKLGLANISLRHQSIQDFNLESGKFDYIICHGVFSWVDSKIQNKILEIFHNCLSPEGVGYLSYNTYPGWKSQNALREMMQYHTAELEDPREKVQQAKALIHFLANSQTDQDSIYAKELQESLAQLLTAPEYYFFHEYLEEINRPFYFYEFLNLLEGHHLEYLADAHFSLMTTVDLPEATQSLLCNLDDRGKLEQYLDFIRNRKLRESLICHQGRSLIDRPNAQQLDNFFASLQVIEEKLEFFDGQESKVYILQNGGVIRSQNPLTIKLVEKLAGLWPEQIRVNDLFKQITQEEEFDLDNPGVRELIDQSKEELFLFYSANLLNLSIFDYTATATVQERPLASSLARCQALSQEQVTSLLHKSIRLESIVRQILALLDGTKDYNQLSKALLDLHQQGLLQIDGLNPSDQNEIIEFINQVLERSLQLLAKNGFLLKS